MQFDLAQFLTIKFKVPFVWGQNDCVHFVAEWVQVMTGVNYLEGIEPWTTESEAMERIASMGGFEAIMDARFTRIDPKTAKDGDIALHKGCLRLFSGTHITSPGPRGLVHFARRGAECAWRLL